MEKKITAVDQLRDMLLKEFGFTYSDNIHDQAKALEKQQIIDAYGKVSVSNNKIISAEQYYNETFNQK